MYLLSTLIGIASLFFLIILTLIYYSKHGTLPGFLKTLREKIEDNMDRLSMAGVVYGAVAVVLTPLLVQGDNFGLLTYLGGNILIFLMALPLALDSLLEKYKDKTESGDAQKIITTLRNIVGFVSDREKGISYAGIVFCVLTFAAVV